MTVTFEDRLREVWYPVLYKSVVQLDFEGGELALTFEREGELFTHYYGPVRNVKVS